MAQLVTETYASALFEVSIESDNIENIYSDYKQIIQVLKSEPEFFEIFKTPKITNDEKKKIVSSVFESKVNAQMLNFIKILIDKRRTYSIIGIFEAFESMYRKHLNKATAIVKSVIPLEDAQCEMLIKKLEILTGYQIEIENVIDERLIGGLLIQIEDRIIDSSVKHKMNTLKDMLVDRVV